MGKRVLLGVCGVVALLLAVVLGSLAGWGQATFADGGSLRMDLGTVVPGDTDTAIVFDVARFGASVPYLDAVGRTQLAVHSAKPDGTQTDMFVGAAATDQVDAFVKGTAYAVGLHDADGWQVRLIPGTLPLPAPGSGSWLAAAAGPTALIDVPTSRPLTVLVARSDGAPVGPVALAADFTVPGARTWTLWLAVAALVALIAGVVLVLLAVRARRPKGAHEVGGPVAEAEPSTVAGETAAETAADAAAEPSTVAGEPSSPVDEAVTRADEPVVEDEAVTRADEPVVEAEPVTVAGEAADVTAADTAAESATVADEPVVGAEPATVAGEAAAETAADTAAEPANMADEPVVGAEPSPPVDELADEPADETPPPADEPSPPADEPATGDDVDRTAEIPVVTTDDPRPA